MTVHVRPMIEPIPGRYFLFVAFLYGKNDCDWLAAVWRDKGGPWHMAYRFRYYASNEPFDERDEKRHYEAEAPATATPAKLRAIMRFAADSLIAAGFNETLDWLDLDTDDPRLVVERMAARPWCHGKRLPIAGEG